MAQITIRIQGAREDAGHVRLTDFIRQLEAVKSSLKHTERLLTDDEDSGLYYRIVQLSYSSPATVTIEATPRPDSIPEIAEKTVSKFVTNLSQVTRGRRPSRIDLTALQSYQNLGSMLKQHLSKVEIKNGHKKVTINDKFADKIARIIGPDEIAEGSMFGTLEWLNIHHTNRFHVYPIIGPKKIDCDFPAHLKPKVIAGIDRYVQVFGQLRYKHLERFPYAVNVKDIDVLPLENDLPTLYDLRGIAPEATGSVSAVDFIRALRDEG